MAKMKHQDLLKGLIRLHILHHASESEFYGQWMIHELARHGYTLSPGTLYPMLHGLEGRGYLKSKKERSGRTFRRFYRATALEIIPTDGMTTALCASSQSHCREMDQDFWHVHPVPGA